MQLSTAITWSSARWRSVSDGSLASSAALVSPPPHLSWFFTSPRRGEVKRALRRLLLPARASGGAAARCRAGGGSCRADAGITGRGARIAGLGPGRMAGLLLADPQIVLHMAHARDGFRQILRTPPLVAVAHGSAQRHLAVL